MRGTSHPTSSIAVVTKLYSMVERGATGHGLAGCGGCQSPSPCHLDQNLAMVVAVFIVLRGAIVMVVDVDVEGSRSWRIGIWLTFIRAEAG